MSKKPIPAPVIDEIWVMAFHTSTPLGSIAHVSHGDRFYTTREACQGAIDTMDPWPGMGDRKRYQPLLLIRAGAIRD